MYMIVEMPLKDCFNSSDLDAVHSLSLRGIQESRPKTPEEIWTYKNFKSDMKKRAAAVKAGDKDKVKDWDHITDESIKKQQASVDTYIGKKRRRI
jgi:hypothetical protein